MSDQHLLPFTDAMDVATFIVQGTGLRYVNGAAARMTGYERSELLAMRFWDVMDPEHQAIVRERGLARQAGAALPRHLEYKLRRKDGTAVWVDFSGIRIDWDGAPAMLGTAVDISDRKHMETALRRSEARLRRLVDANILAVIISDTHGNLIEVNDAFLAMLGYTRPDVPRRWDLLTAPESLPMDALAIRSLRETGIAAPYEKEYLHRDGHRVPILLGAALLDRDAEQCICFVVDLSERKRAERALEDSLAELRASQEKLRRFAAGQVAIREAERKRLGFDLHDNVCQELIGIGMMISSARRRLESAAPEMAVELHRASGYVDELAEHLRQLARELGPLQLRDFGLEESLRSLAARTSSRRTSVTADIRGPIPRLGEETEVAVYRVTQEALANAMRHAGARVVTVSLRVSENGLRLAIRDDGRGFDPSARDPDALGLMSMEERALALGGALHVESTPGAGTTLIFECPPADARSRAELSRRGQSTR